ncbi:FAD-binding oxidoreductase [Candidatus Saccharibacteria bacterium]|nr:FAD-binding oxidoreductase [Candidatus Saccharibacteria bacterium]
MGKIAKYLNQLTVGNVFDNPEILEQYSTDRSVLKIKPKFVAFPESTEDIRKLMRFFNQLANKDIKVALTARGSGMSEGGESLTNGLIISTEKLNQMLEIDTHERLVRVQAGITLKELNTALSVSGLTIPIDGRDGETIGGLISNYPNDESAGKYGGIYNFVERVEVVLANGECLQTNRLRKYAVAKKAAEKSFEGTVYRKITKLIHDNDKLLTEISEKNRALAGYTTILKTTKRETLDLMPLFFGAQGTLGIISEVILRAVPLKNRPVRIVATFKEMPQTLKYLEKIGEMKPRKLNLYDLKIIMKAKEAGKNLDGVIRKLEDGWTVLASFDEKGNGYLKKIMSLREEFPRNAKFIFESDENRLLLNEFENSLANYLNYVKNGERVPILTDFYLPAWNLNNFLQDLEILKKKLDLELELFGSYSSSIYSLRPKFDLEEAEINKKIMTFLRAGAFIIERQGGELTGGTPEGRLKAVVSNIKMSEPEKNLYLEIKKIFDQNGILNPDVKLGANSKFTLTHLRTVNQPKIMI